MACVLPLGGGLINSFPKCIMLGRLSGIWMPLARMAWSLEVYSPPLPVNSGSLDVPHTRSPCYRRRCGIFESCLLIRRQLQLVITASIPVRSKIDGRWLSVGFSLLYISLLSLYPSPLLVAPFLSSFSSSRPCRRFALISHLGSLLLLELC